jgi:hypothetical protein
MGRSQPTGTTLADIERLKRMRWSELERAALEAGVPLVAIKRAVTRDELRRAILLARNKSSP